MRFPIREEQQRSSMKEQHASTDRRDEKAGDIAEYRRLTAALAARIKLSGRLAPGPKRKQGSPAERAAHLTNQHD